MAVPAEAPIRQHITVLLHEAVDALLHRPDGTYIDGTFGRGGHSRLILSRLAPGGRLMAIDRDPEAVAHAREGDTRIDDTRFSIDHTRFADYPEVMAAHGVAQVDGILLDIGVSSPQIDDPARGFSFRHDGPLDMRMDPTRGQSAAEFLATAPFERIAEVIRVYGEERFAGPLARAIVARREAGQPLARTSELAALAATVVRTRERGQDPATRTFQALRILVNGELDELEQALEASLAEHLKAINASLDPHERLQTLVVTTTAWTVDNDVITPTFKVKRNRIEDLYARYYDSWESSGKTVIWQ